MPNWWLPWAERIARVLAEAWLRTRPAGGNETAPPAANPTASGVPPHAGPPGGTPRDPA
jgi:hypothetical protein